MDGSVQVIEEENRDEFDGGHHWLFLCAIKAAKRAGSFNIFLIIEAVHAAF
jgi:hypothetical protein